MSIRARYEYLQKIRERYKYASKTQKKMILDEFCDICGYNRKYAIRLINAKPQKDISKNLSKRGRKKIYHDPLLIEVLRDLWRITNLPCATRLKAIIPLWLPHYDKYILPPEIINKLLKVSASTIYRLLKPYRTQYGKKGLATTKPGSILKKQIPVKTNQWDESIPGFIEADTVAHCGNSTAGQFVYTLNCVDIATGWTEQRAVWGKGERGILNAINDIEKSIPFALQGFDCDNGSEFLNWHLHRYLTNRKQPVQFTRTRAYHKNDNAHIENKNWTHIRQYLGYQRFEHFELVEKLNDLYTSEWNDYFNFFIPSVKLISKTRHGAKVIKKHDKPKTPVQRLLESDYLASDIKERLSHKQTILNPIYLQKQMTVKITEILKLVNYFLNEENSKAF